MQSNERIDFLLQAVQDILELAERPLYRSLEAGFRHHALSSIENRQRMAESLEEITIIAREALGWSDRT
jgi:hypothetical protein